jgi:hypothetical protein
MFNLEEELKRIKADFIQIGDILERIAGEVIQQGITRYPVFVAHQEDIRLGLPLANAAQLGLQWNYRISMLEELVRKGLVSDEASVEFKRTYLDPESKACLFLVTPSGNAHFVFLPYQLE